MSLYRKVFATFFALLNFCYARFSPASSIAPPPLLALPSAHPSATSHHHAAFTPAPPSSTPKHIPASYFRIFLFGLRLTFTFTDKLWRRVYPSLRVSLCVCVRASMLSSILHFSQGGGAVCLPTLNINRSAFYLFASTLWGLLGKYGCKNVFARVSSPVCVCLCVCMLVSLSVSYR